MGVSGGISDRRRLPDSDPLGESSPEPEPLEEWEPIGFVGGNYWKKTKNPLAEAEYWQKKAKSVQAYKDRHKVMASELLDHFIKVTVDKAEDVVCIFLRFKYLEICVATLK